MLRLEVVSKAILIHRELDSIFVTIVKNSIQIWEFSYLKRKMKLLGNLSSKFAAAALVKRGLSNEKMANRKQIMDCIFFQANGLGEN